MTIEYFIAVVVSVIFALVMALQNHFSKFVILIIGYLFGVLLGWGLWG